MCPRHKETTGGGTLTTIDLHTHTRKMHIGAAKGGQGCGACAVGRSPVGCPPSMARSYHRVGLAPMAAEMRLPTSSDSATCLVPSVFHTVRTSTPRLFSYSLPTNRQLTGRDLFEVFWLLEHEYPMVRRLLFRDFRLLSAFSRQDAAASPLTA